MVGELKLLRASDTKRFEIVSPLVLCSNSPVSKYSRDLVAKLPIYVQCTYLTLSHQIWNTESLNSIPWKCDRYLFDRQRMSPICKRLFESHVLDFFSCFLITDHCEPHSNSRGGSGSSNPLGPVLHRNPQTPTRDVPNIVYPVIFAHVNASRSSSSYFAFRFVRNRELLKVRVLNLAKNVWKTFLDALEADSC